IFAKRRNGDQAEQSPRRASVRRVSLQFAESNLAGQLLRTRRTKDACVSSKDDAGTREIIDDVFDFRLTRRSVLAGGTALAVSTTVKAAAPAPTRHFNLDFLDKTRRQVVVLTDVSAERDTTEKNKKVDLTLDLDKETREKQS